MHNASATDELKPCQLPSYLLSHMSIAILRTSWSIKQVVSLSRATKEIAAQTHVHHKHSDTYAIFTSVLIRWSTDASLEYIRADKFVTSVLYAEPISSLVVTYTRLIDNYRIVG